MDSSLVTLLTGSAGSVGVLAVVCVLFITGFIVPKSVVNDLKARDAAKDEQIRFERDRADAAVSAVQATHDVMTAVQAGIRMAQTERTPAAGEQPNGGGPAP